VDKYALKKERRMSMTEEELEKLKKECLKLPVGEEDSFRSNDYVLTLLLTYLNFQMKVEAVDSAIDFYTENRRRKLRTHKALAELMATFPNTKRGNLKLANYLWNNSHWTRAKFLRKLVEYFEGMNVRNMRALTRWGRNTPFEEIKGRVKTEEHSIGYAIFKWIQIRLGVDTVKPDVHVKNFVKNCIGREPRNEEAVEAIERIARKMGIPASRLDFAIWRYQRDRSLTKQGNGTGSSVGLVATVSNERSAKSRVPFQERSEG